MSYKNKYIKYKLKYLSLKNVNHIGGVSKTDKEEEELKEIWRKIDLDNFYKKVEEVINILNNSKNRKTYIENYNVNDENENKDRNKEDYESIWKSKLGGINNIY
tara:strand:+ start:39 stop:350 length:312 start_codon:yes stop_codon:yes gene_type:complete